MTVLRVFGFMSSSYRSRNNLCKYGLFFIFYFLFSPVGAQTFTQQLLQQNGKGKGTVTVHQDDDITRLVNSEVLNAARPATVRTAAPADNGKQPSAAATATAKSDSRADAGARNNGQADNGQAEAPAPDLSKKVMRGGVKVNGYRVQAFAGGNSRKDRIEAERIGNNIKMHFAEVPVYVHFYSPRWICRVGNYRTYEEAHQMLVQLRNMGYSQASIVKGKITVQY